MIQLYFQTPPAAALRDVSRNAAGIGNEIHRLDQALRDYGGVTSPTTLKAPDPWAN
jgi:hypothetical protein